MTFENTFFDYINNAVRQAKVQPLNLGGYTAVSGGAGGPPGGFQGYLPQSRVAYDETEAETLETPVSGQSILDNLNHIRARLTNLSQGTGVIVEDDGVIVASGITILDFINDFDVNLSGSKVTIALQSGTAEGTSISGIYGEDLSAQIPGSHFDTVNTYVSGTLEVYYNGLRQAPSFVVLDSDYSGFTTTFTTLSGDSIVVDYDVSISSTSVGAHTHSEYITKAEIYSGYYNSSQTDLLLYTKSNLGHTHTESEITDLVHDAVSILGITVSGTPSDGQALGYSSLYNVYTPITVSGLTSIKQQFVFTLEGVVDSSVVGTKPFRIYSHQDDCTIDEIMCALDTAPASTPVRVDVLLNGVTIFDVTEYVEIGVGSNTATKSTDFGTSTFDKDDYFQFEVVQGDSTASDLTVHVRFSWS